MVKYLFVLIYDQIKYSSASARLKKNNSGPAIFFTTNARYNQINSCIQLFGTQKIYRSRKKPEEQIAELFFIDSQKSGIAFNQVFLLKPFQRLGNFGKFTTFMNLAGLNEGCQKQGFPSVK